MRAVIRHVTYRAAQDPMGEVSRRAVCVSGDDTDCGADSGEVPTEEAAVEWMAKHTAETGHKRYQRTYTDYAIVEPAE